MSSSEEEREEKLNEGMSKLGEGWADGNVCVPESAINRSVEFMTWSPSGQPLRRSWWSYKRILIIRVQRKKVGKRYVN